MRGVRGRAAAVIGTSLSIILAVVAAVRQDWRFLLGGVLQGYAWAWVRAICGRPAAPMCYSRGAKRSVYWGRCGWAVQVGHFFFEVPR